MSDPEFDDEWDEGWTGLDTALVVAGVLVVLAILFVML